MWISTSSFLTVPALIWVPPMGEETDPVNESLVCSRYRVNGMSPCEPPCAVHSHVPVKGPGLGFFACDCSCASAKPATHNIPRLRTKGIIFLIFMHLLLVQSHEIDYRGILQRVREFR